MPQRCVRIPVIIQKLRSMSVHTPSPLPPPPPQRPPPTTRYSWRNIHPNTTLHYIKDVEQADLCLEKLQGPVGFDLEWKPTFKKGAPENPVALVQLANKDTIMLIQISAMKGMAFRLLLSPDSNASKLRISTKASGFPGKSRFCQSRRCHTESVYLWSAPMASANRDGR